jgi:hypothetical protein
MIFITDVEESKRICRELRARGVKWASGREITDDWANLVGWVFKVEDGKLWCKTPCELNNATLAKIPKPEPCVVIRHEVQKEGILRLLDELGVLLPQGVKPSEWDIRWRYPYVLIFKSKNLITYQPVDCCPNPTLSTKDFMEGVKNALL